MSAAGSLVQGDGKDVESEVANLQKDVNSAASSAASAADCELPAGIPRTTSNKAYLGWLWVRMQALP